VGKYKELRLRILQGESDANIDFDDLCRMLRSLGFDERVRGSHHIFRKHGVRELVNLQREGSKAKVYQVRQVRGVILRYGLGGEGEE
jgi:predicted RNA binding protein YcfA (HicA-like mRNA interferase family)